MANRKNTFLIKRSNVAGKVPVAGDLQLGELALNTADNILYASGTTANSILPIGWDRVARTGDTVTGNFNFFGDIKISGSSLPNGYALSVTGDTNFVGDVYVTGDLTYNGSLLVTGGTVIQSGLTANTIYTDYIDFNTNYSGATLPAGRLQWDDGNGTLVLGLKGGISDMEIGLENMALCYNAEATTLTAGTVVYVSGSQGNRPSVKRAIATGDGYSVTTLGVVSESIASGAQGFVTTFGMVNNLNTVGYSGGTPIWLSPTDAGGYTTVKPQAPNHTVLIGYIVRVHASVGSVFVQVSNGWEIDELHDVRINNKVQGDLLTLSAYNGSDVWVNSKTLNGSYTITGDTTVGGTMKATTISATTYQNLPADLWTQNDTSIYYNTGNVGIGVSNPTRKFEVVDGTSLAYFNLTGTSGPAAVVLTTDLTKLTRFIAGDGTNSISVGMRTSGETANPGFGGQNDAFIYVNTTANGLNIINAQNTGVNSDYIRLYAGLIPTQGISHLHVQGSGATKGFIGINTENPIARLHVSGDTLINGNLSATTVSATTITATTITSNGDLRGSTLISTQSSGDEGGDLKLATAATNTTLSGGSITVDIYQNRFRIFESGGSNRGVYIDLTAAATGVGTNLLSGGGGEINTASNLGAGTGLFAQKVAADLQFKSLTSTGGTVTISNDANTVNLEVIPASNFTGGTVTGATTFTGGLNANTISATTYQNLPFSGTVIGNGTANYLPKWTGTTGLSNSIIQDNGTNIGVGNIPNSAYKVIVYGGGISAVYGSASATNKYGIVGTNFADDAGTYIGGYFAASPNDTPISSNDYIGAKFVADGFASANAYSVQLQDNTEGINKVLVSQTSDGKANWSSVLSGLTGVYTNTISATTYQNLPISTDTFVTGATYSNNTFTYTNNTGGTFNVLFDTVTGLTSTGTIQTSTLSATTITANTVTTFIPAFTPQEIYRGVTFSNNSTTVTTFGGVTMSTTASNLAISVSSTDFASKQIRLRYYSTTVSGGRYTGTRGSALLWYIHGGFRYICDFRISDTSFASTCQQFYGLAGSTADLAYGGVGLTQVSTLTNLIGVGNDGADTNLQIIHNDASGTATKIDLGVDFPANRTAGAASTTTYSVTLYNAPASNTVKYMVVNNETGAVAMGEITTNLPATTQGLNFFASRAMGGGGGVTGSGQFELSKLGVYSLL